MTKIYVLSVYFKGLEKIDTFIYYNEQECADALNKLIQYDIAYKITEKDIY